MYRNYGCLLLALISSGFSLPEELLRASSGMRTLPTRGNDYGASTGFKPANIKDYPYLASIAFLTTPVGVGAIINKHWVLTSALFSLAPAQDANIFVGTNMAGRSGHRLNVTKFIAHKKFNSHYLELYNIGLMKTEQPIEFSDKVKAVKLAKSAPKVGTNCTVLGYGFIQTPYAEFDLGAGAVSVRPREPCEKQNYSMKTSFCAGAEGVVPFIGDIADLLMYKDKLAGLYVAGLSDSLTVGQIYTNVPMFKKWIWKTIKDYSNDDEMEGLDEDQFI